MTLNEHRIYFSKYTTIEISFRAHILMILISSTEVSHHQVGHICERIKKIKTVAIGCEILNYLEVLVV